MENNLSELNDLNGVNIFKPEYKGFNKTKNITFLKWKELMLTKFGEKSNYFYCDKDLIFFWVDHNTIKNNLYCATCPTCKKRICLFCSSINIYDYYICCLKRLMYSLVFIGGPSNIKNNLIFKGKYRYLKWIFIPGLSFIGISIQIRHLLTKGREMSFYETYFDYKILTEGIVSILLSFPFFILNTYFIIILTLVSIPFKFTPLKFFIGVLDLNNSILPCDIYFGDRY